jgi:hypothetical protein
MIPTSSALLEHYITSTPRNPSFSPYTLHHAVIYALHCVNIHTKDPVLIMMGPASGSPHLVVLNTIHSDVK